MQFRAPPLRKTQVDPSRTFHFHVQPEHAPNLSRIDKLFQYLQAGMKPHVVANLNVPVAAPSLGNQGLDSTRFVRKRLLDKNVGVSLQRGQRLLHVVHRRGADHYDIRPEFLQRRAIVAEHFPVQFLTGLLQRFGAGIAKGKPLHPKRLQIPCVPAANRTATDYQNPISYPVGNRRHEVILIAWTRANASARLSLHISLSKWVKTLRTAWITSPTSASVMPWNIGKLISRS